MQTSPNAVRNISIACAAGVCALAFLWFIHSYSVTATDLCNVAYIPVQGTLVTYIPMSEGSTTGNSSDQTASEDVTRAIRDAGTDPSIKGIVLEIDSPGGSPVAGEEIETALKDSSKPTAALIRDEGDSAAYMAASGADAIFASQFSDVGDIGITQSYSDNAKQDAQEGITFNQLSIGKYKDMFNTDKPMTADERTLALQQLQLDYDDFVNIVAANRHMATDTALTLADGASETGQQALSDGLVDRIGNIDAVRDYMADKISDDAVICGIDSK